MSPPVEPNGSLPLFGLFCMAAAVLYRHFLFGSDTGYASPHSGASMTPTSTSTTATTRSFPTLTADQEDHRVQQELRRHQASDPNNRQGLQVFNSFLQDEGTLRTLANSTLWSHCMSTGPFWIQEAQIHQKGNINGDDNDIWKSLVQRIWTSPTTRGMDKILQDAVGFEYWCNILSPDTPLGWHYDRDERAFETHDNIRTPLMGAVYYGYPHALRGGFLEMIQADSTMSSDGLEQWVYEFHDAERVRPEYNRMIMLNVSKWHGVSEIYVKCDQRACSDGKRYTFAVNAWGTKPMGYQ